MALQCVILAGGVGSRMKPITETIPKAMIPVAGQPFAHHQLSWLAASGVKKIVYSIGHKGQLIRDFVGDGRAWKLSVEYVDDGPTLKGTAGALRLANDAGVLEDSFFVLYGDSYLPIALAPVEDAFRTSGLPALMTVLRNRGQWDVSNVLFSGGRVVLYDKARRDPRAQAMDFIDYGLSVLTRGVLEERVPAGTNVDLATVFHGLSVEGKLAGFEVSERFYEIGSPSGLQDLEAYLSGGHR